jgi:hypothetical protein
MSKWSWMLIKQARVLHGLMLIVSRDWESSGKERREKGLRAEEGFMIVCG